MTRDEPESRWGALKDLMTIAELARLSNVGVETVRYYQRLGLLSIPPPREHSYRRYGNDALAELHFVRRCKALGFALKEIKALVGLHHHGHRTSCSRLHGKLETLSSQLDAKLKQIERQQDAVRDLLQLCEGDKPLTECTAYGNLQGKVPRHLTPADRGRPPEKPPQ